MASRIVQVPMEEEEARALAGAARRLGRSRAELIRAACRQYLLRLEQEEQELAYQAGYRGLPESEDVGSASVALAVAVLPPEDWS